MQLDQAVQRHYRNDHLESAVLQGLAAAGCDLEHLTLDQLAPVDEFHLGGRRATEALAGALGLQGGQHLLDIGSGLGGPSRYLAATRGVRVTGIDLTADYVRTAGSLARRVGLAHAVTYLQGSALDLPFAAASFDAACLLHVGMNIRDKGALFAQVARVLKPGGGFAAYDVMWTGAAAALQFPLPWASEPATSFVAAADTYVRLLEGHGFHLMERRDLGQLALEGLRRARAGEPGAPPPPLGLHLVRGAQAGAEFGNLRHALEHGLVSPVLLVFRYRGP